jgi:tRNA A-37 threonylcarbamoyl transferase component Bud32/tetratricopeptide (TPR) repeat protein
MIGQMLGPYRVLEKLGEGGMGEVYKARDLELHRDVAIKVLPEHLAGDRDRLARLKREARTLAALNHPNIATLFGFESHGGTDFLAMELVSGDTLAAMVEGGPLPLDRALEVCAQVGDALAAAHQQGITHRDVKPANIKVTPEGRVKVLDFGLAKSMDFADSTATTTSVSLGRTDDGRLVGTPAYMSPEQIRAKAPDHRADIWAFGCLLFELLSGRRPFPGDTVSDTLAKILEREPDWKTLPSTTPAAIVQLIRRCLEKDADRRLSTIAEARLAIGDVQKAGWRPSRRVIGAVALTSVALAVLLGGYWFVVSGRPVAGLPGASRDAAVPESRPAVGGEKVRSPAPAAPDPAAHRLYLQGRYFWNRRTDDDLRKSADAFQQAISRDPNYALAWAGLADAYLMLGAWSVVRPADAYPRAKAAAERAIALDGSLAEPHATLGYLKTIHEWDWPGADREFRRAVALQPAYATAHHWYAYYYLTVGDFSHAISEIERARELDPLSQVINDEVGYFYFTVRNYPKALEETNRTIELAAGSPKARMRLAEVYALLDRPDDALAVLRTLKVDADSNYNEVVSAAHVYARCGERATALALIREAESRARQRYMMPAMLAGPYASVGNKDRAFELLSQSIDDRSLVASWLRLPRFDNLHGDPRFKALFERLKLPM